VALPFALAATAVEVAARAGGTIYVEARREPGPADEGLTGSREVLDGRVPPGNGVRRDGADG
ncbi:MAG: hypothetical protein ACREOE_07695, partial [Gemmatimonadales bacterium]